MRIGEGTLRDLKNLNKGGREMEKSESIVKLAEALSKAQGMIDREKESLLVFSLFRKLYGKFKNNKPSTITGK